jgi:hypothetical protein
MADDISESALGFRAHSGWAVAVSVAGSPAKPLVLERSRIKRCRNRPDALAADAIDALASKLPPLIG